LGSIAAKEELARKAVPGQAIYDEELAPGARIKREQPQGLITMNGQPLPDRVTIYWRRTGQEKRVSTTLLAKRLSIIEPDGLPRFVTEKPDLPPSDFVAVCEVCLENKGIEKKFERKFHYVNHMDTFHQLEWRVMEEERKEALQGGITAGALLDALKALTPEDRQELLGGSNGNATGTQDAGAGGGHQELRQDEQGGTGTVACPDCGKSGIKPTGLGLHQRKWCKAVGARAD